MEFKEHGNYLIVSMTMDDNIAELTSRVATHVREKPNSPVLLTMNETPDELIERMKSVTGKVECELQPSDIQDILAFGRSDVHLDHYRGHRNLTSACLVSGRHQKPLSIPKDPTKGRGGMPYKRGKGSFR